MSCVGESSGDGVAGERGAAAGREERVGGEAAAFVEPVRRAGGGLGERGDAVLASFAAAGDVRRGGEVDVGVREAGEFGDAQAGLDRELEHRAVAPADPGAGSGAVSSAWISGSLRWVIRRAVVAFGWDREDAGDQGGVFGVAEAGEAVERVDRG